MSSFPLKSFRVSLIQNGAGADWEKNVQKILIQINKALKSKPHLIALPETFYYRGPSGKLSYLAKKITPQVIETFQKLAKEHRVAFLLGSVLEASSQRNKIYNTSILISEKGRLVAKYRKIHLFDNQLPKVRTLESKHIMAGKKIVVGKVWGVNLGLSVCYDLRFPELYRALSKKKCQILCVPANFTYETGKAHWEVLLRSRAIENLAFVIAPGQVGIHPSTKIKSFGRSLIVDPWGNELAKAGVSREETVFASLDLQFQTKIRKFFPVLQHRRLRSI